MNCIEFEVVLCDVVEARAGRLSDEAVAHAQTCSACAKLHQDYELIEAAVIQWRPVETPSGLSDAVLRSLLDKASQPQTMRREEGVASPRRAAVERWGVVVAAACMTLACWLGASGLRESPAPKMADSSKPRSSAAITPEAATAPIEVSQSVVALLSDLRAEYRGLADETTATARDLVAVLPQPVEWSSNPAAEPVEDETSSSPVQEIGRSIGDQIGQAIGFLWQTVPSSVPQS